MRVRETGLTTYPDVTIVRGAREVDEVDPHAVVNPTALVEVLSRTTEQYDRGDKFEHYKRLASLRQYVLVSQLDRQLEVWTRQPAGAWTCETFGDGDTARLDSVDAEIEVRELYDAAAPG